jgi:hypothetical protein
MSSNNNQVRISKDDTFKLQELLGIPFMDCINLMVKYKTLDGVLDSIKGYERPRDSSSDASG